MSEEEKPQKIHISRGEQEYYNDWCLRCDKYFCLQCIDLYEVNFDIKENAFEDRLDLKPYIINWKGKKVCPWCYNQLVENYLKLRNGN